MASFFSGSGLWFSLAGIFLLLFVIANVPRPQIESIPWLLLAGSCALIAWLPTGTLPRWGHSAIAIFWVDTTMRWHCIAAVTLSLAGFFVSMGLTGVVPVLTTHGLFHPLPSQWAGWKQPTGDDVWPFLLLSSGLWPWAFPAAYFVASRCANAWTTVAYAAVVLSWWVAQSLALTQLTFHRWFFLVR